jgi:hypothetical protein
MRNKHFEWWHGAAFYVAVQMTQWGLRRVSRHLKGNLAPIDRRADREWYKSRRLPVFAPPGIAFPIAWGINSISAIAGSLRVFKSSTPEVWAERFSKVSGRCMGLICRIRYSLFRAAIAHQRSARNPCIWWPDSNFHSRCSQRFEEAPNRALLGNDCGLAHDRYSCGRDAGVVEP